MYWAFLWWKIVVHELLVLLHIFWGVLIAVNVFFFVGLLTHSCVTILHFADVGSTAWVHLACRDAVSYVALHLLSCINFTFHTYCPVGVMLRFWNVFTETFTRCALRYHRVKTNSIIFIGTIKNIRRIWMLIKMCLDLLLSRNIILISFKRLRRLSGKSSCGLTHWKTFWHISWLCLLVRRQLHIIFKETFKLLSFSYEGYFLNLVDILL